MGWFWTSVLVLGIGLVVGGLFSRALVGCGAFTEKAGRMLFAFVMLFVVSFLGAVWLFTSVFDPSQDIFVLVGIVLVFTLFATLFGIVLGKANIKDKERIAKEREDDPSLVLSPEERERLQRSQQRWEKVLRAVAALAVVYYVLRALGHLLG